MAAEPGKKTARSVRGKALVFGSSATGRRVADSLREQGFDVDLPGWTDEFLPRVFAPGAQEKLRHLLRQFAQANPGPLTLHPAHSVWAERPELLTIAQECGYQVLAPPVRALTLFASKLSLIALGESLKMSTLVVPPGDPMSSLREIQSFIRTKKLPFPVILKTAKVGSQFGVIVLQEEKDIDTKLPLWIEQLRNHCGEVILFAERYLEGARQVSIPFARLPDGHLELFPAVDGSLQSRHRKVVEFCPAEGVAPAVQEQIETWTTKLAQECGYVGVGQLDFLIDGDRPYLVGGRANLDVSHPLWEKVAGTSAVAWQLQALSKGRRENHPEKKLDRRWASAIAMRVYAEDPVLQLPQPGHVVETIEKRNWELVSSAAELDLMVHSGETVPPFENGLVAVLFGGAQNRTQAILTSRGILDEFWIAGELQTNERFLSELLHHPWVREGVFHTGFLDEEFVPALRPPAEFASLMASVLLNLPISKVAEGDRWAAAGQWIQPTQGQIQWVGEPKFFEEGGVLGVVRVPDSRVLRACAYPLGENKWQVRLGTWTLMVRRVPARAKPISKPVPKLNSMIPGRVYSVLFRGGATVRAHEPLLIVETLGMLVPHALPVDARILSWKVAAQDRVTAGQELAELEILSKN